jgi:electron transfer flavoprotein alpha subunit
VDPLAPGEWRTVWTWIEIHDGEVLPACLELLGRGREIADELGTRNCAVVFGQGIAQAAAQLGEYGADRVYVIDAPEYKAFQLDAAREALSGLIRERRPEILLFPATIQGRNLGAQVATEMGTGIVPNCNALSLDATERLVIGHQTSFEEHLVSEITVPTERPQIFTVTPGSYRRPGRDRSRNPGSEQSSRPGAAYRRGERAGLRHSVRRSQHLGSHGRHAGRAAAAAVRLSA